jgi:hypothetical protein
MSLKASPVLVLSIVLVVSVIVSACNGSSGSSQNAAPSSPSVSTPSSSGGQVKHPVRIQNVDDQAHFGIDELEVLNPITLEGPGSARFIDIQDGAILPENKISDPNRERCYIYLNSEWSDSVLASGRVLNVTGSRVESPEDSWGSSSGIVFKIKDSSVDSVGCFPGAGEPVPSKEKVASMLNGILKF